MPGVQIHAAVADDILSNRFIREASPFVRIVTVTAAAIVIGLVASAVPAWWAAAATVLFLAAFSWVATRLFAGGYWLNLSQPVLASSFALFGGVAYQYFFEGREKRKMKKLFGQYVSKDVYEQLVANPALARLGGQRREMTVLFSDIRGFTTVSERGQPEEIVGMLNEYFTRMVAIVFAHQGTLDKFVGDMVMALFGAPLDDPDHADHAVDAALDMIAALGELNARWKAEGARRAGHRHRHQHRADDRRQHRIGRDHELHRDRRRREPRVAARIAQQAVRDSDYHQRRDAPTAEPAATGSARSATSSSKARRSRWRFSKSWAGNGGYGGNGFTRRNGATENERRQHAAARDRPARVATKDARKHKRRPTVRLRFRALSLRAGPATPAAVARHSPLHFSVPLFLRVIPLSPSPLFPVTVG